MEFRILGPLEAVADGLPVTPGAAKQRALLGILLLHANEVVAVERLVDELWGAAAPPSATKLVQTYVSQLRRRLGPARVVTRPPGYLVAVERGELDAERFDELVAEGDAERRAGEPERALDAYEAALRLWRGEVLADAPLEGARDEIARLEELRVAAAERRLDCLLALGRHAEGVGELEALVSQHPYHEAFLAQLMLALYRSGRQSDALAAYRRARRRLVEELGIEPGPGLRELEQSILVHDDALRAPAARLPGRRRRTVVLAAALAAAGAAALAAAALTSRGGGSRPLVALHHDAVAVIDPLRNALVSELRLPSRPSAIVYVPPAIWVATPDDHALLELDPRSGRVLRALGIGIAAQRLAAAGRWLWAVGATSHSLVQVNVRTHTVVRTVRLPRRAGVGPLRGAALDWTFQLAASPRGAWVALGADVLTRVDGRSGDVEQLPIGSTSGVAFDGRSLWSAADVEDRPGSRSGTMARVDPRTARIEEQLPLPDFGPGYPTNAIAADERAVWGVVEQAHALWRLDADSLRVTSVLSVRGGPFAIALGARGGWTANDDGTVSRVDRATGSLVATIPLGRYPRIAYPTAIATGPHAVWVTVR